MSTGLAPVSYQQARVEEICSRTSNWWREVSPTGAAIAITLSWLTSVCPKVLATAERGAKVEAAVSAAVARAAKGKEAFMSSVRWGFVCYVLIVGVSFLGLAGDRSTLVIVHE